MATNLQTLLQMFPESETAQKLLDWLSREETQQTANAFIKLVTKYTTAIQPYIDAGVVYADHFERLGENGVHSIMYISLLRFFYENEPQYSGNPMYAWAAIAEHQKITLTNPEYNSPQWAVSAVLARAQPITDMPKSNATITFGVMKKAFGFPTTRWITHYREFDTRKTIFFAIAKLLKQGISQTEAIIQIAEEYDKGDEWVRKLYQDYNKILTQKSLPNPWGP